MALRPLLSPSTCLPYISHSSALTILAPRAHNTYRAAQRSRVHHRPRTQSSTTSNGYSTASPPQDYARIVEVGPRDGLQNEKTTIPLATKLELIRRLAETGVTDMEAGSFVRGEWVPQVRCCKRQSIHGIRASKAYRSIKGGQHLGPTT